MESSDEDMDKTCALRLLSRLAQWIGQGPLPAIPFVGQAHGRCHNPPARHVELVLMLEGGYRPLHVGNLSAPLLTGQVSIHNVHCGNYADPEPGTHCWCMFLDVGNGMPELAKSPVLHVMPVTRLAQLAAAFELVSLRCRAPGVPNAHYLHGPWAHDPRMPRDGAAQLLIRAAIMELLALLLQELAQGGPAEGPESIRIAVEYMTRHYARPDLSLEEIAASVHLSPDHLGRSFRLAMRVSPIRYLRLLRLQHARYLLEHSQLQVQEIAQETGFADPLHFSRFFREATGTSPRQYRQRMGQVSLDRPGGR